MTAEIIEDQHPAKLLAKGEDDEAEAKKDYVHIGSEDTPERVG
jgi:hypothetical protein